MTKHGVRKKVSEYDQEIPQSHTAEAHLQAKQFMYLKSTGIKGEDRTVNCIRI